MGEEPSIGQLASTLVVEAKDYARAEAALLKARAGVKLAAARTAAIFFGIAFLLAQAALTALLVGAILSLQAWMAAPWATLIVVVVALFVAVVLAKLGISFASAKSTS